MMEGCSLKPGSTLTEKNNMKRRTKIKGDKIPL
jgi:hypothetical protein